MKSLPIRTFVGFVFALCCLAPVTQAATIGYWQFDDGTVGSSAGTLVTQVNSTALDGTAQTSGSGPLPVFSASTPNVTIVDGLGPVVNDIDSSSLYFVNTGLPGDPNSHNGGRVSIPGSSALMKPSDFTIEAFVKIDEHVNFATILSKSRADAGGGSFTIDTSNNGTLRLRVDSQALGLGGGSPGFNQGFGTSAFLEDGQWHHIAVTYTAATQAIDLFFDYVDVGGGTTINPIVYDDNPLLIGQGGGGRAFDGWIDEVRFSDVVLTPDQFLHTVPEPSTLAMLLGTIAIGLLGWARRR